MSASRVVAAAAAVTLLILRAPTADAASPACGRVVATLASDQVKESSGLARGLANPGVFWTHNDSGDGPRLYAFGADGGARGFADLEGPDVRNVDWEDLSSFTENGRPFLLVADTGDNRLERSVYTLYVVPEPDLSAAGRHATVTPIRTIRFRYEDGSHDCEAAAVDPSSGAVYLVTKVWSGKAGIYAVACPESTDDEPCRAVAIGTASLTRATGMDFSADGLRAVVVTRGDAFELSRGAEESWTDAFARKPRRVSLPHRKQGEAICYGPDDATLYLTSECGKRESGPCVPLLEVPREREEAPEKR
ncbi:MAG: hypothetical protein ACYDBY_10415 [Thermoanaerobaculia bacterium]